MDYAGHDISMDETDVCVLDREGVLVCESKTAQRRSPSRWRKRQVVVVWFSIRANGADPVSRLEPTRSPRGLSG
jgi:hypothetical protein